MKLDTFSSYNLDEVVFENRNKLYGAYELRKSYDSHLTKAILGSLAFFLLLYSGLYLKSVIVPVHHPNVMEDPIVLDSHLEFIVDLPKPPEVPTVRLQPRTPPPNDGEMQIVTHPTQPPVVTPPTTPAVVNPIGPPTEGATTTATASTGTSNTNTNTTFPPVEVNTTSTYETSGVQFLPEFPGGIEGLHEYLLNNLQFPAQADLIGVNGTVLVSFVVDKDGTIKDVTILRSLGFGCNEEAIRVVEKMPQWKPGKQNGKDVAVRFTLPIKFVHQ